MGVEDDVIKILTDSSEKQRYMRDHDDCLLTETQIMEILGKSVKVFMSQPSLLEIAAPVNVCGDIHGQFYDLLWLFQCGRYPPRSNYLFLGDYVDRGKYSIECITLLLAYKVKYPENFFLLRGNHETPHISYIYGFYDECKKRFKKTLWKSFMHCFETFPIAAIIEDKIFCCHGGLSPELKHMDQIKNIRRPAQIPKEGLLCDLVWADPNRENRNGWSYNERGISYTFGADVVNNFLNEHKFSLVCRAHQVTRKGFEFFANDKLVTLFSAPCYGSQCRNDGAIMQVEKDLHCSFICLTLRSRNEETIKKGAACEKSSTTLDL